MTLFAPLGGGGGGLGYSGYVFRILGHSIIARPFLLPTKVLVSAFPFTFPPLSNVGLFFALVGFMGA